MQKTILVADQEFEVLKLALEGEGYTILTALRGDEVLERAHERPDLILLDILLPGLDGWEVARSLQLDPRTRSIPFIFLAGQGRDSDEIIGLELGAADVLAKPFSPDVLKARVRAALRKARDLSAADSSIVRIGAVEIDIPNFSVRIDGSYVFFPKKEFEVLATLLKNRGRVLSRQTILDAVWGPGSDVFDRTVDVHITKIRDKLGEHGTLIETLKRVGYRFTA